MSAADPVDQEPHSDPAALLARCREAALEREGIAMVVALHDARPGRGIVETPADPADGPRWAELLDHYTAALDAAGWPGQVPAAEDLTGGAARLVDALVVLSEHHLRAPVADHA